MKTQITDDLELDEETVAAARREAVKSGCTLGAVLSRWIVEKARQIKASAQSCQQPGQHVAA